MKNILVNILGILCFVTPAAFIAAFLIGLNSTIDINDRLLQFDMGDQVLSIAYPVGLLIIAISYWFLFFSELVPKDKRLLWSVVLFSVNVFALPFFAAIYIRKYPDLPTNT